MATDAETSAMESPGSAESKTAPGIPEGVPGVPSGRAAEGDDMSHLDPQNIITGKRKRRRTSRFVDSKEWQDAYGKLILDDIPAEEIEAALVDDDVDDAVVVSESDEERSDDEEDDGFFQADGDDVDDSDDEFGSDASCDECKRESGDEDCSDDE
jgi:hypothetical protein